MVHNFEYFWMHIPIFYLIKVKQHFIVVSLSLWLVVEYLFPKYQYWIGIGWYWELKYWYQLLSITVQHYWKHDKTKVWKWAKLSWKAEMFLLNHKTWHPYSHVWAYKVKLLLRASIFQVYQAGCYRVITNFAFLSILWYLTFQFFISALPDVCGVFKNEVGFLRVEELK